MWGSTPAETAWRWSVYESLVRSLNVNSEEDLSHPPAATFFLIGPGIVKTGRRVMRVSQVSRRLCVDWGTTGHATSMSACLNSRLGMLQTG